MILKILNCQKKALGANTPEQVPACYPVLVAFVHLVKLIPRSASMYECDIRPGVIGNGSNVSIYYLSKPYSLLTRISRLGTKKI